MSVLDFAKERLATLKKERAFDPARPDSRPTAKQEAVLQGINQYAHRYLVGGNQSGKSSVGARELTWIFKGTHPYFKAPEKWQGRPLQLMVVGQTRSIVTDTLWMQKIKPFLEDGSYDIKMEGAVIARVTDKETQNTILFTSHNHSGPSTRKLQSRVLNYVWLDEMPNSMTVLEELHRRVQALDGKFLATFTPKDLRNIHIKNIVDAENSVQKKYQIGMLENPIYSDPGKQEELLATISTYPIGRQRCILYGDWWLGDNAVYSFEPEKCVETPSNYAYDWPHLESVDPAATGNVGYALFARSPNTQQWYVVRSEYIPGQSPDKLFNEIQAKSKGYNIVRRVCDSNSSWFIKYAAERKVNYAIVHQKTSRKLELIKQLQSALDSGRLKIAYPDNNKDLVDEFTSCQWSETADERIVGATRFHLLDAVQYGLDLLPTIKDVELPKSYQHELIILVKQQKEQREKLAKLMRGRAWRRR